MEEFLPIAQEVLHSLYGFTEDNLIWVLGALAVIIIVLKVVKTVVRWLITFTIISVLYGVGMYFDKPIDGLGSLIVDKTIEETKEEWVQRLISYGNSVDYTETEDGDFTISSGKITLKGNLNETDGTISLYEQDIDVEINEELRLYIEGIKSYAEEKE